MDLPLSTPLASRLLWLDEVGSTNTDLAARITGADAEQWSDFSVVATDNQVAGKGRLGRDWRSPAGASLAVSVLLRPQTPAGRPLPPESWGWFGLLAGLAMTRACNSVLPENTAQLKWPNDVLIGDRKVCGVLSEIVNTPQGAALIVGAGVNVALVEEDLPVPTATSLLLSGADPQTTTIDAVLSAYLAEFSRITKVFTSAAGNVRSSGLLDQVSEACGTLGKSVRVELPSGESPVGTALGINEDGSLVVELGNCAEPLVVAAGDVTHLRVVAGS
ncbi:BirA family biotin operon repressor/biotin-[acetyl-CoA-carboxylase] ligase [Aurantimicrobium minutum]|uniref:biotin--[acetyl-CoA-carboxylase] ligase n=1 Tax=Aurantimicrobium minutum TaxID=708131 RepID=UPI002474C6E7|nr:biotin--[acetyl-CoA-carboxylase] ligase [Aurantimicrobium minutum]MDH6531835.1 BirA family biotin operon repressor/biotin-[acetyl-CoA-carboxylase] ligase [Aurantimicrobium minutum]